MWDGPLALDDGDDSDILRQLERELILRGFNHQQLGMEEKSTESDMEKLIGVGKRRFKSPDIPHDEGRLMSVIDFKPSYFRRVSRAFQTTPVAKHFGINIAQAMALPVDQWYEIEEDAKLLADREEPDSESRLFELMKQMISNMIPRVTE